jgi:predicted dienelactone hydrolase
MLPIDAILLAGLIAAAVWRLAAPNRGRQARAVLCVGLVLVAGAQYALKGFTWQFVPGYLLLAATALPVRRAGVVSRWAGGMGLAILIVAALAPWALRPAPVLPQPRGPHPVGEQVFRWVDASREEATTPDPADRRNVVVQAWYPADPGPAGNPRGGGTPYLDGLGRLPGPIMAFPSFVFRRFGETDTHATPNAPVSNARRTWPVVIFSPGYGAPRAFYTGLAADLASRGYVVLAVDHPYEAAVTQLADGRVAGPAQYYGRGTERSAYMERQIPVRAADLRFVLDEMARPGAMGPQLAARLDTDHVAAAGHSFGGATAVLAASKDPRIKAIADIDGMLYGPVRGETLRGPLLLLESDHDGTGFRARYVEATEAVLSRVPAGGWRYAIGGANHFSFTDADHFFSPPGRWAVAQVMGGERGAAATQRAAVDILDAFLRGPLKGQPADVAAAVARYEGLRGGPSRR